MFKLAITGYLSETYSCIADLLFILFPQKSCVDKVLLSLFLKPEGERKR